MMALWQVKFRLTTIEIVGTPFLATFAAMTRLNIGILREGKIPPDNRTPLKPRQCYELKQQYPDLDICVEWTAYRCCSDEDYKKFGISVVENVDGCDLLLGIKEVPVDKLISGKTYMFFSHTSKKQPHNRRLLQAILEKKITLIDYELITDDRGNRLIGFGRWAGIVGAHYALLMLGQRTKAFKLKAASQCVNLQEVLDQYEDIQIPAAKFVITGNGRVSHGALEVMDFANITRVSKEDFLNKKFPYPVYVQLNSEDLYTKTGQTEFDRGDFHKHPGQYENAFLPFTKVADVLINCMFWHPLAPRLFEVKDIENPDFKTKLISDVSCDVNGSVAITFRESTIADPVYGVHISDKRIGKPYEEDTIDVMAVANLPNELPLDASRDFGKILMETVLPKYMLSHDYPLFERATIAKGGHLTPRYAYLQDWVDGKE